jgi:hypothetical protein
MRVPGKPFEVFRWGVGPKIIQEQEWIEKLRIAKADGPVQVNPGPLDGRPAPDNLADAPVLAHAGSLLSSSVVSVCPMGTSNA